MKGRNEHLFLICCLAQWILLVIYFILPHSEASCQITSCNLSQCIGNLCNGCNDGSYLQYGLSCVPCYLSLPGCATCSSSTSCTKCSDGYYRQYGLCIQCQLSLPYCVTCSSPTSCIQCSDGYYLQSGSCIQCPDRCSTCTSSTQCTTCKDTYWNLLSYCSFTCSTYCTNNACDDTTGYCYDCKPGTYGPTCRQDCNLCKDGQCDLRKCKNGCKDGYYQEISHSGYSYCYTCTYGTCLTCSNGTYCTQCEQGYYRNYYRQSFGRGRGTMNCLQCYDSCLDCTSTEHCHEDCIQHCYETINPRTTQSTYETTPKTYPQSRTQNTSESFKLTTTTSTEDCQCLNEELNEELNSNQRQIKTCRERDDQYQLTFGHGFATGIGTTIVLFGAGVGIVLLIKKRTTLHKHETQEENHEYVNTNMSHILSVIASENNVNTNDIRSVPSDTPNTGNTNIDSSRDYVSLGGRPTHESDYSDLQNT